MLRWIALGVPTLAVQTQVRIDDPAGFVGRVDLADEADVPADIVLWHGSRADDNRPGLRESLAKAGDIVIGDRDLPRDRARAA